VLGLRNTYAAVEALTLIEPADHGVAKSKETKVNECGTTERSLGRRGMPISLRAFPAFSDQSHDLRTIDIDVHTRYIERRGGSRLRFDNIDLPILALDSDFSFFVCLVQ
jgi:hypothetical protein